MKIISKQEIFENKQFYLNEIIKGKIFVYPTDTIYGIGCIASNSNSIEKIKEAKQRDKNKPLSVIVPSINWIKNNFIILENHKKYLEKLPGPYTFILKKKKENNNLKKNVSNNNFIGIRIPNNWFSKIISETNNAFITTSVNLSGEPNITKITEIKKKIKNKVDYIINDGIINGKPSTIINLTNKKEIIIRK